MKRILLAAAAILTIGASNTFAQEVKTATTSQEKSTNVTSNSVPKRDPKAMAAAKANRLEKALDLTADQKQKVSDIFLSEAPTSGGMNLNPETEAKIKEVLTKDQIVKYDAMKAKRMESMQNGIAK